MTENNKTPSYQEFDEQLKQSFAYCCALTRANAKNFYYGICLTPKAKRWAICAIYAWMKTLDDIVDGSETLPVKQEQLNQFYAKTVTVLDPKSSSADEWQREQFWLAFRQTILFYQIPFEYLQSMFDGQLQDLQASTFQNFAELYQYCYRVASTVGLICIKIWGYEGGQATEKLAEYEGIAFQLTNILRDVTTDKKLGRSYLPGASHSKEQLDSVIRELIEKTSYYYAESKGLNQFIHPDGRASLLAMRNIYYHIFLKLKAHPERIPYQDPVKINILEKIFLMLKSMFA